MNQPKLQLCRRIQQRDPKALEELYIENERMLFVFIHRLIKNKDQAEELMRDLFKHLWEEAPHIHDLTTRQWLFKHARIRSIQILKQQTQDNQHIARMLS